MMPSDISSEIVEALYRFGRGFRIAGSLPPVFSDAVLRGVEADTLLIVGEDDALFSPSGIVKRAEHLIPNLRCAETMPAHGHSLELSPVTMDRAAKFLSDTASFIDTSTCD